MFGVGFPIVPSLCLSAVGEPDEGPRSEGRLGKTEVRALRRILDILATRRAHMRATRKLGSIALVTGSLGPGGAELQMTRTAEILGTAIRTGRRIAGVKLAGPVHVVVRSLTAAPGRCPDFFLPRLSRTDVAVWEVERLPTRAVKDLVVGDEEIESLLPLLSSAVLYGLPLIDWFRQQNVDVAYIWQDGAILFAAWAALLAGVKRIVINLRGLPPNIRRKSYPAEFVELYSALATMPGVSFVSNSDVSAHAYADWIGAPRGLFHIVRNGIEPQPSHPPAREIRSWTEFDARTGPTSITVGSVFRLHPDKRPLEWIRFCRRFLDIHPRARFIIVGNGDLLTAVKELAYSLRVMDRLLIVPQTRATTFWLEKMDAFVLLSRFEGTPNVLLEAQLAGVPVVSTPVANAKDTFLDGVTGFATSTADLLDLDEVVSKVDRVVAYSRAGETVAGQARRHVAARFSTQTMIRHTVRVLASLDTPSAPRRRQAAELLDFGDFRGCAAAAGISILE
jgi:glycosyltransferase involved in cell wall biosynthesis